jgi:membrane-associated phospholipid phosphatase
MPVLYYRNFLAGVLISAITALCLLLSSWLLGKDAFFLMLNADLGNIADYFFHYWTYMGDGVIWVPVLILVIIYRKKMLPLIIAAIVLSTLITQLTKNYVFPGEPRPTYGLADLKNIHTVEGVELHTVNSFPSGHTGTAFTVFLTGCLLIRNRWFTALGFIGAALVGYSRIYLAQHFPLDVGAGIITGIITAFFSLEIQKKWTKRV